MSLRQRIVLTLLAITVILVIPATYGFFALRDLERITSELRARDTQSTLILGRLQTTLEEADRAQGSFIALRRDSVFSRQWRRERDSLIAQVNRDFQQLAARQSPSAEYREAVARATERWNRLLRIYGEETRQLEQQIELGDVDTLSTYRRSVVNPAYVSLDRSLAPIAEAIDTEGRDKVQRAREVADRAGTTMLAALALALLLTVVIGSLLTRALLRPIGELRKGMAHVAEGDFSPDVRVPVERPDEIGDLARSFGTMTTQLAELDRLKAEFVSVASHEIKTPLSVIRGYVSLLADGIYGEVSDPQRKTLGSISDQVDRLTRLVHRLLDISRFEAGGGRLEVRRINVRDFLAELTGGFDVLAFQNGIDFRVRVADDVPVNIEGDADRLNEVLGNLLSNAFKFTPRGGTIRLDASRSGAEVVVEVEDTGVGIPPDKLPRIFEKFYQVENEAQPRSVGSGLGLAIAREIVEAHGGMIGAESRVGQGTKFTVTLPERPPAHRLADTHPAPERR